jgi:hypothetical protein
MKVICTLGVLSQHIASHQLLPFSLPLLPEAYFANNQYLGLVQSPIGGDPVEEGAPNWRLRPGAARLAPRN